VKVFGSDGFRSKFGEKYMTIEFIIAFARSISYFHIKNLNNVPVLIGRDTRISGNIIENLISGILNYNGIDVVSAGIMPTPGLSFSLKEDKYSLGIMITASHDKAQNNGIKLFSSSGVKLDEKSEKIIESDILSQLGVLEKKENEKIGSTRFKASLAKRYEYSLIERFPDLTLEKKILVDCSFGAFHSIARKSLINFKSINYINDKPEGKKINFKCGALEPQILLDLVKTNDFDYGIAFDGDGDRVIFVSRDYGIIETEKLLILFANYLSSKSSSKSIVSTEICNKGLELNCQNLGFKLEQVAVGDRNVVNKVLNHQCLIGAEPSGHYFFPKKSLTMDGLLTVFYFLEILSHYKDQLPDQLYKLIHFNRLTKDIPIRNNYSSRLFVKDLYDSLIPIIDNNTEKLIIRKSMWDPVIRIYYDYKENSNIDYINSRIINYICK
tara:strand:+ start:33165 stop:34484 length:1320 start_codon:yes stop_codon:yes gene_type:complete